MAKHLSKALTQNLSRVVGHCQVKEGLILGLVAKEHGKSCTVLCEAPASVLRSVPRRPAGRGQDDVGRDDGCGHCVEVFLLPGSASFTIMLLTPDAAHTRCCSHQAPLTAVAADAQGH